MRPAVRLLLLLGIVGVLGADARGDGKFFVKEKVPPGVPYQRAILLFQDGRETLILQSKYDVDQSVEIDSIGWIVPVPAVPEIAGGDASVASHCFQMASMQTQPHLSHVSDLLPPVLLALFAAGCVFLVVCLLRYPLARRSEESKAAWSRQAQYGVIVTMVALFIGMMWLPSLSRSAGSAGVEVVKAEQAGIYDVKVIRGTSAGAILEWLKESEFSFDESDRQVFQDYIDRGWCFVTAKVGPDAEADDRRVVYEGLAAPLILKFDSEQPIYPLALTATVGTETEILIYPLSGANLTCNERLPLRHARKADARRILQILVAQAEIEEWPLLRDVPEKAMMLCKFKGRLTPAQMSQDLEFTPAQDNEPYRERKIVW